VDLKVNVLSKMMMIVMCLKYSSNEKKRKFTFGKSLGKQSLRRRIMRRKCKEDMNSNISLPLIEHN
jgi:hypothetical protein